MAIILASVFSFIRIIASFITLQLVFLSYIFLLCKKFTRVRLHHRKIERPSVGWIFAHFKYLVLHLDHVDGLFIAMTRLIWDWVFLHIG